MTVGDCLRCLPDKTNKACQIRKRQRSQIRDIRFLRILQITLVWLSSAAENVQFAGWEVRDAHWQDMLQATRATMCIRRTASPADTRDA